MTIREVSKKYGISADTLRYYERIGLIPNVPRRSNGIRDYDETACDWVEFIKCMRGAGVQIEALAEYVSLCFRPNTAEARKEILVEQRERLRDEIAAMQATLARLDKKIEHYDDCIIPAEKKLLADSQGQAQE